MHRMTLANLYHLTDYISSIFRSRQSTSSSKPAPLNSNCSLAVSPYMLLIYNSYKTIHTLNSGCPQLVAVRHGMQTTSVTYNMIAQYNMYMHSTKGPFPLNLEDTLSFM